MVLTGEENIRNVVAFPKNGSGVDVMMNSPSVVDEAQILSRAQVWQLSEVVDRLRIPVLCYGLRTDFRGQPFAGSTMLLALAESLEEIKNVCSCGRKATMNIRCDAEGKRLREGPQILIGDANYRQACACCFYTD